jgi:hypothetical protein
MLRALCADDRGRKLLLSEPSGQLVRVACHRELASPQDAHSIDLKVYNHLPFPVTCHWKDFDGKELVYPVHVVIRETQRRQAELEWDDPVIDADGYWSELDEWTSDGVHQFLKQTP